MSLMSANTVAGGWLTSAERLTSRILRILPLPSHHGQRRPRPPPDRREPQGTLRVLHRGALRGGAGARGLGSEGHARRACTAEGGLRLPARQRSVPDRRAPLGAALGLHPRDPRPGSHAQAAPQPQRARRARRRGGAARLHARAARALLEERPRQARRRPRQGQEAARQARGGEGPRLGARQGPRAQARLAPHSGASFSFFSSYTRLSVVSESRRPEPGGGLLLSEIW